MGAMGRGTSTGMQAFLRALDALLGAEFAETLEPETRRRARSLALVSLVLGCIGAAYALQWATLGLGALSALMAVMVVASTVNLLALRHHRITAVAGHLGTALLFGTQCATAWSFGGFFDVGFAWFYLVPLVAALLVGTRGLVFWFAGTMSALLFFWTFQVHGPGLQTILAEADQPAAALMSRVLAVVAVTFTAGALIRIQSRQERSLLDANTTLVEQAEQLHSLAWFDPLTGLPNRAQFQRRLDEALAVARRGERRLALLFVDLDGFKSVNDALGHSVGDKLLAAVGARMAAELRSEDVLGRRDGDGAMARLGGDEFTLLLTDLRSPADAARVASRLIACLEPGFPVGGRELFTAASIGIALFPDDADSAEGLVRSADAAMYAAKGRGRGRFAFSSAELDQAGARRLAVENSLRRALGGQELSVAFQLIHAAADGAPVAAEALLRWENVTLGAVPPDEFVPIAEESGLIGPLGDWVLDRALTAFAAWPDRPPRLALNVSARQLEDPGFLDRLAAALDAAGLSPEVLDVEVTETALLRTASVVQDALVGIRTLGARLVLDDFGKGYSSLERLRRIEIDALKIDRSFVAGCATSERDRALAVGIIRLAQGLGLRVTAEGVETEEQRRFLADAGVDALQGFLLSRPELAPSG